MNQISKLEEFRKTYQPKLPPCLKLGIASVVVNKGAATQSVSDQDAIKSLFPNTYGLPSIQFSSKPSQSPAGPLKVGVVLSGGQAPGGHNVISGVYDGLQNLNSKSVLLGFLGGPSGLENGKFIELNQNIIDAHRNTGGFDIIGSGRTKLETREQFEKCRKVIAQHEINAIIVIGGDDSNTNAAVLAEYLKAAGDKTCVIGVPKTIDGDLKNEHIPCSFGFDTAVKTYSELVGNIERDSRSALKYWHFIKLMGRSASHIALEVALQTHPNVALISEEVAEKKLSLENIVEQICGSIISRASAGKNYGVVLVPEGLIEFIPSMKALISDLNNLLAEKEEAFSQLDNMADKIKMITEALNPASAAVFKTLPGTIQAQLLLDRDPHGNVQVSRIDTEALLIELVAANLKKAKASGKYTGKFSSQHHFFGYEGRCAPPSNFDADYTYSLGFGAVALIKAGATGYMSSISGVTDSSANWKAGGIPITMLFNLEQRHGEQKPVIQKALVKLNGKPFKAFESARNSWAVDDCYVYPGPIQYFGPSEICDAVTITLALEQGAK